ncbi:MAG TPA: XdhC family protein [Acidobacteriaceae bacterium]|jgi:xanthine/CO dehydrogenase XdhC/CoxF family maturation factor|nr:XdhC family protein [Acidobacteriaceae bacterium]
MAELRQILDLWKRASAAGEEICLATVVGIEGSAYRRPGARMLMTAGGERAGTVSGGCLEAEIVKKAWWLTEKGPSIQRYSSFFGDDGDLPYGLGCGGTVIILLERGEAAAQCLAALRRSAEERTASVIVSGTGLDGAGTRLIANAGGAIVYAREAEPELERLALEALERRASRPAGEFFVERVGAPPALTIFGAGDDARPLVEFAAALGWHVTVADGRANLARGERFPQAARVSGLEAALAALTSDDATVVMTHSYEQDRQILRGLLTRELKYIGTLGPRARTERLVQEVVGELGLETEACLARLHSPVGLDLGGHAPESIALSIAAELQAVFAGRGAKKLSGVPAVHA